jgi:hypothetical protein
VRIEAHTAAEKGGDGSRWVLSIDLGFFRVWLRDGSGRRLPLVCGCALAQSIVEFERGSSSADPAIAALPERVRAVIVFGTGRQPTVRLEAVDPGPFLEGRTRLRFSTDAATVAADEPGPCGTVTVLPEWFTAARPDGVSGPGAIADEIEVLLNAWLEPLFQPAPAATFGS